MLKIQNRDRLDSYYTCQIMGRFGEHNLHQVFKRLCDIGFIKLGEKINFHCPHSIYIYS